MAIVCPDIGENNFLKIMVGKTTSTDLVLHLYKNNPGGLEATVPPEGTWLNVNPNGSPANYQLQECDAAGYEAKTLTGGSWAVTTNGGTGETTAVYGSEQSFVLTEAADIYGYYVTSNRNPTGWTAGMATGELLWLERLEGAPFQIPENGGTVLVTPEVQLA